MSAISQLTPLLSSTPYLLAYTLPLLLISLLLTFSGTYLTLDRSRTFPPVDPGTGKGYSALSTPGGFTSGTKKRKFTCALEGGVGGLAGGYVFGIHLSTALALLIPGTTSADPLSCKSFLAIWILMCTVTTLLSGRYHYATLTFLGISGGTLTALAICIITHPTLSSRIILTGLFLPLFTVLLLLVGILPITRLTNSLLHPFLRICTASTGAFGVILSVALLMKPQEEGWANAWERLYLAHGPVSADGQIGWGTSQERGLSAGYAVFLFVGIAADWALRRWIGDCPDEKWDKYLANYTSSLPNDANRAGSFQPHKSFLDRLFAAQPPKAHKDILFPNEVDMKMAFTQSRDQPLPLPVTMRNASPKSKKQKGMELTRVPTSTEVLKKKRSKKVRGERRERKPVKFGDITDSSSDDEETKKASSSSSSPPLGSPRSQWKGVRLTDSKIAQLKGHLYRTTSSTPTLVDRPTPREGKARDRSQDNDKRLDNLATLDYEQEIAQLKERLRRRGSQAHSTGTAEKDFDLEYSDYEEDLTTQRKLLRSTSLQANTNVKSRKQAEGQDAWSPAFLQRHQSANDGGISVLPVPPLLMHQPAPVPATPSLIRALDRLALAQRDAYGHATAASPLRAQQRMASASPGGEVIFSGERGGDGEDERGGDGERVERSPRWEDFWREVKVKAQT